MAEKFVKLLGNGKLKTANVDPSQIDHNLLANLASGDVHTQYTKKSPSATDNSIVRFDTTDGRTIQNSLASIDDNGGVIAGNLIRPGTTSDTTAGNIRYNGTELQGRYGSAWRILGIAYSSLTSVTRTTTTSGTYSTISTMTTTPVAGTYLVIFNCTTELGSDSAGDVALFVGGTIQAVTNRMLYIEAAGLLGSVAAYDCPVNIITSLTFNGSQVLDARFRLSSGSGPLGCVERELILIPYVR